MNDLVTKLNEIITSTNFFSVKQTQLKKQILKRKKIILKDIYLAAALLNPASLGSELNRDDKFTTLHIQYG